MRIFLTHKKQIVTMCLGRLTPKQKCFQKSLKLFVELMSYRKFDGRLFRVHGPAAPKLLSPKLLRVRGTSLVLAEAGRCVCGHLDDSASGLG